MQNVRVNFCDILFAFLEKCLLCIYENIMCDQEGLHLLVAPLHLPPFPLPVPGVPTLGLTTNKGNDIKLPPAGPLALGWIHSVAPSVTECLHTIFVQSVGDVNNGEKQHLNGRESSCTQKLLCQVQINLSADCCRMWICSQVNILTTKKNNGNIYEKYGRKLPQASTWNKSFIAFTMKVELNLRL